MPVYEYTNDRGERFERVCPIGQRDENIPEGFRRRTVPHRINVCFYDGPTPQRDQVLKGLYQCEQRLTPQEFRRDIPWTKNQLKKIWREEHGPAQ